MRFVIRAGLVWPYQAQPVYWLILGQREKKNAFGRHSLVLLEDGKVRDLDKLFDSMTDAAVRLRCEDVCVDMSEEPYLPWQDTVLHSDYRL
jgi:hypothetical protein